MKVVIPACGKGERFRVAGYNASKPLISVYGSPMIDRVVDALNLCESLDRYVVVINFNAHKLRHPIIHVDGETKGALETTLLALKAENSAVTDDTPLLVVDCDAVYHTDIVSKFRILSHRQELRAAVLSFEENDEDKKSAPKYSYVQVDDEHKVIEIAEKARVGPLANTGAYWFASSQEFMKLGEIIITGKKFQHGEAYVSCVLNEYIKQDLTVYAITIQEDEYSNIGTPDCLHKYLTKQGRAFLFDLDGTLVDTTTAYVHAWKKLFSKKVFVDTEFFNTHISGLNDHQVAEKFKISVSSCKKDDEFLKHLETVREIPGAVTFVKKCCTIGLVYIVTNSNREAATALQRRIGLEDIPLLTANDVVNGKPNSEPYSKAMMALGASPSNCVVFEDSKHGLTSARAAGAGIVIAVSNNMSGCDAFYENFANLDPHDMMQHIESVTHLSNELTALLGKRSMVYPVRASGGYISEILSASSGSHKLVIKQETKDHGVLHDVSEHLGLHTRECHFYASLANFAPVRIPRCYGILPVSRAIVMEDLRRFDRAPDFNLENSLKVVQNVASLHSHFKGMNLGALSTHMSYMKEYISRNYQNFRRDWKDTLPEDVIALFDHAAQFYEDAESILLQNPRTLLHGDLKFPNLFWDNNVKGGEPIFIDWQYTRPGQGIEDVVFLLVESCEISNFKFMAEALINAYFDERQKLDGMEFPPTQRRVQVSCALVGFPLFVAVWFGCMDASKLIEPNFPFLYITKLANAFSQLYDTNWTELKRSREDQGCS